MGGVALGRGPIAGALAVLTLCLASTPARAVAASWTTYRHDAVRSGVDPDSASPLAPSQLWQTAPLDGEVYGQPLVYGSTVYVATENDTVYALDAATGAILWQRSVGTPVPAGQLPCGNIKPVVGITSTPVIDPATAAIYVVADTWDGSNPQSISHRLFGLSVTDGSPVAGLPTTVDPPGSIPTAQLQRVGLALDGANVIVGYGGNDGDCGTYHGWLVAAPENGAGALHGYEVEPSSKGGAIWAAGNAPPVDASGDIWAATGNGSGSTYGGQESVLKLDPALNLLDHWAPGNWQSLDLFDKDLGSSAPVLLPGGLVFQIGKGGVGYLLSSSSLGGTAGKPLHQASVCSASFGGGIYVGGVIYVACAKGMHALTLNATKQTFAARTGWKVNGSAIGPPTYAGGLVWSVGWGTGVLYGLDPSTGVTRFSKNLGRFDHFASPSAGGGRLFVANGNQLTAFTIAS
jgi:outer membrane protein assembly factor BamB